VLPSPLRQRRHPLSSQPNLQLPISTVALQPCGFEGYDMAKKIVPPSRRVSSRKGTDRKSLRWLKESQAQGDRSLRLLLSPSKDGVAVLACITRLN
jgi:hypothetical protein